MKDLRFLGMDISGLEPRIWQWEQGPEERWPRLFNDICETDDLTQAGPYSPCTDLGGCPMVCFGSGKKRYTRASQASCLREFSWHCCHEQMSPFEDAYSAFYDVHILRRQPCSISLTVGGCASSHL
ncbi:hypothetical protein BD289DRAFT_281654 [Coniella lustricola]|uniref:Uncharacterized protein n=1 Tax=Coniella lustricola TaxID=2025994 RepID=A0A2T3A5X8_9PEZI|nr:hypothetical protein BD289DRAFT_281654 [Coniella lustricola]